jgi:ABC-type nitrate/sulfonate/bicarbonate transport system substrate-binding protein
MRITFTGIIHLQLFEMIPSYQGTCGAASRRWAEQHTDRLTRYIRAYVEATRWCFDRRNRRSCLDILARHDEMDRLAAEHPLDGLLHPELRPYPKAALNMSGVLAALELRAEVGYLARPIPPVEKYVDQSCYQNAVSTERSVAE